MKVLYITLALVATILIVLSLKQNGESTIFYGIAETREIVINSDHAVEIKKIHVQQGQTINQGDTLIELNRPELTIKIKELTNQVSQAKSQQSAKANRIKAQIKELEAQYELNKKLTSQLKSIPNQKTAKKDDAHNPIKIKIDNLKRELSITKSSTQVKEEIILLQQEIYKLTKSAQISGVIGSVNFKEGEKVSPFAPIITLHTKSPSSIKGYIHENVYNKVSVDQKVMVASLSDKRNKVEGVVIGVGSRIVEYPLRLRKRPDIQIWGREIIIKIPNENSFLLGEKVLITAIVNQGITQSLTE